MVYTSMLINGLLSIYIFIYMTIVNTYMNVYRNKGYIKQAKIIFHKNTWNELTYLHNYVQNKIKIRFGPQIFRYRIKNKDEESKCTKPANMLMKLHVLERLFQT